MDFYTFYYMLNKQKYKKFLLNKVIKNKFYIILNKIYFYLIE